MRQIGMLTLMLVVLASQFTFAQTRPNVVLILADDQGWGDLSINGNTNVQTPNIDRIGREGAQFKRFYVAPLCAPTRAGLLTGRYHYRTGVWGVSNSREFMNLDEETLADVFKKAGYATGCFGKWHNGSQYPYHPNGRGFDDFYGMLSGHYANYFNTTIDHGGVPVKADGYIADALTNQALGFIEKNRDKPFLCYIPYNTPHSPFQVPDAYFDRVKNRGVSKLSGKSDEDIQATIASWAMTENLDDNVGRVLKKLKDLKLDKNTIVVYLSDNGPNTWRWNGDMAGRKGVAGEGSIRAPFLIRWPGVIPAGNVVNDNGAYIDVLPTLTDLASISSRPAKPLDGVSLKPVLVKKGVTIPERTLFLSINKNNSVRKGEWAYDGDALYDLKNDPSQKKDLAQNRAGLADSLKRAFDQWYAEVYRNVKVSRPLPVGYKEFPTTVLPSQDAVLHKSKGATLSYSASAPNSSWIANWNDTISYVTWPVDVHTAGRYQVKIRYTSPTAGSQFNLSVSGKVIAGSISKAFDPALLPSPDRVKRSAESYEKEFRTLTVGEMTLPSGESELKLTPTKLINGRFADVRAVELVLLE